MVPPAANETTISPSALSSTFWEECQIRSRTAWATADENFTLTFTEDSSTIPKDCLRCSSGRYSRGSSNRSDPLVTSQIRSREKVRSACRLWAYPRRYKPPLWKTSV